MSKNKKPFAESTVGKLLFGAASIVNPTLGNVLKGVTSPADAIAAIGKSDASNDDKIKLQQLIYEQHLFRSGRDGMQMPHQIHGFQKMYALWF
jgi:hypothetical protein